MEHALVLFGAVPSKKNRLRPRKGGGLMNDKAVTAMMDGFQLQAQNQWKQEPLEHADVSMDFHVLNGNSDLDGKFTFVLDVLVKAGVLRDDRISRVPRISAVAEIGEWEEESVTVRLEV